MTYQKKIKRYDEALQAKLSSNCLEPVVLLEFYRTKMQIECVVFPCIISGTTYNTFNDYKDSVIKILEKSPHDIFKLVINQKAPSILQPYCYLLDLSFKARYKQQLITKREMRRFKKYHRDILDWIDKTSTIVK